MRRFFVFGWLLFLLSCVAAVFWYNEWVYTLPTPMPENYKTVSIGTVVQIPGAATAGEHKPLFLHFFNPDCPCSRFNLEHVKSLIKEYGNEVRFKLVLVTDKNYTERDIQDRFKLAVPVIRNNGLAALCGVYSTPQAVLIDTLQQLYYRGNYNRSRYCVDKKTNYAQAALAALLNNNYKVHFEPLALRAYGCQLPGCTKNQ